MTEARCTLTIPGLSHDAAGRLASELEDGILLDPLAIAVNETDEAGRLWEVVLYFEDEDEARRAAAVIARPEASVSAVPAQDWVRRSLEGLAPVVAGRFFLHGSHDRHRRRQGGISLEIDAGTAFGTGHHGTTEGCLLAADAILKRRHPKRILDVGCGTGVLAIAAAKASGSKAIASDIDPEAVRVTLANAALNGVRPLIDSLAAAGLDHPRLAQAAPYDLIFANILARPLAALATGLARILAPGGDLILSGLTRDQLRWIEAVYVSRGLALARRILRGNWATLVFTRPQKRKRPGGRTPGRLQVAGSRGAGWEADA
jgi:ribosomal protein L11 methyltransferase